MEINFVKAAAVAAAAAATAAVELARGERQRVATAAAVNPRRER